MSDRRWRYCPACGNPLPLRQDQVEDDELDPQLERDDDDCDEGDEEDSE